MSEFYRINEIARLYGLHADTLRYYEEQGLLSPSRGENNYRRYGIQDICTLNIIQNLRTLDMPINCIREYLKDRTVDRTLDMLEEETRLIDERIAALSQLRRGVELRATEIREARRLPEGVCRIVELAPRPCYLLSEGVTLEEDVDFLLKKLESRHEERLRSYGDRQMGATLDSEWLARGSYDHYANAFYICEDIADYDHILPAGHYACVVYRGRYQNLAGALPRLYAYMEGNGLRADGPPIELYHVDIHDTGLREEYCTEVQVKTVPA